MEINDAIEEQEDNTLKLPDRVTVVQRFYHVSNQSAEEFFSSTTQFLRDKEQPFDRSPPQPLTEKTLIKTGWIVGERNLILIHNKNPEIKLTGTSEEDLKQYEQAIEKQSLLVWIDDCSSPLLVYPQEVLPIRPLCNHRVYLEPKFEPVLYRITVFPR